MARRGELKKPFWNKKGSELDVFVGIEQLIKNGTRGQGMVIKLQRRVCATRGKLKMECTPPEG